MMADQARRLRELAQEKVGSPARGKATSGGNRGRICRSIAVTSGKGGVGKSNVSLSLAVALSQMRKKTLLFDADLGLANIHILLGLAPKHNLLHVVNGACSIEDALCAGPEGVTILPGSSGIAAMADLERYRLEELQRKLSRIEESYDFMIIDGGAGIGKNTMLMSSSAGTALLVLTPEPTALADVYATAKVLVSMGVTDLQVLVNMAGNEREGREIFEKLRGLVRNFLRREIRLSGIIPFDRDVPKMVRMQRNPMQSKPSSRFAAGIQGYARALCGTSPGRVGFFDRLLAGIGKGSPDGENEL
ncbi:MAG: P-loop NTPase [Chitinivibrionales bacterium]|nr:P-loop NTPase [Chitinivibrionales bacterium]MBD3356680.1 P-loop NTPase [Chitinivibrionales bacterium]